MDILTARPTASTPPLRGFVLSVSLTEEEARRAGTSLDKIAQALRFQLSAMLPAASTEFTYLIPAPARGRAQSPRSVIHRLPSEKGLVIDLPREQARIDGKDVGLSQREFELLRVLIESAHTPLDRPALFAEVWGEADDDANLRTIDVTVRRLRSRLGSHGATIRTIRGLGYRFDPLPGVTVLAAPTSSLSRAS
ncbi:MAG: winged helix-turn-helix domain-containing protein [Arachnia sp.]